MLQRELTKRNFKDFGGHFEVEVVNEFPPPEEYGGLCFTAVEPNAKISLSNVMGSYSTTKNGRVWTPYELGSEITLSKVGDKVYFAATSVNADVVKAGISDKQHFAITGGKVKASGNTMSLYDVDMATGNMTAWGFNGLFVVD